MKGTIQEELKFMKLDREKVSLYWHVVNYRVICNMDEDTADFHAAGMLPHCYRISCFRMCVCVCVCMCKIML